MSVVVRAKSVRVWLDSSLDDFLLSFDLHSTLVLWSASRMYQLTPSDTSLIPHRSSWCHPASLPAAKKSRLGNATFRILVCAP
jgi:hypothetical protein